MEPRNKIRFTFCNKETPLYICQNQEGLRMFSVSVFFRESCHLFENNCYNMDNKPKGLGTEKLKTNCIKKGCQLFENLEKYIIYSYWYQMKVVWEAFGVNRVFFPVVYDGQSENPLCFKTGFPFNRWISISSLGLTISVVMKVSVTVSDWTRSGSEIRSRRIKSSTDRDCYTSYHKYFRETTSVCLNYHLTT